MWAEITDTFIVDAVILHSPPRLNYENYLEQNELAGITHQIGFELLRRVWFMHDSAPLKHFTK